MNWKLEAHKMGRLANEASNGWGKALNLCRTFFAIGVLFGIGLMLILAAIFL